MPEWKGFRTRVRFPPGPLRLNKLDSICNPCSVERNDNGAVWISYTVPLFLWYGVDVKLTTSSLKVSLIILNRHVWMGKIWCGCVCENEWCEKTMQIMEDKDTSINRSALSSCVLLPDVLYWTYKEGNRKRLPDCNCQLIFIVVNYLR